MHDGWLSKKHQRAAPRRSAPAVCSGRPRVSPCCCALRTDAPWRLRRLHFDVKPNCDLKFNFFSEDDDASHTTSAATPSILCSLLSSTCYSPHPEPPTACRRVQWPKRESRNKLNCCTYPLSHAKGCNLKVKVVGVATV